MSTNTKKQVKALEKLRLPELWERFTELTGETSRSPNKKFLIRRIREARETKETEPAAEPKRPARPKTPQKATKAGNSATAKKATKAKKRTDKESSTITTRATTAKDETPLTKLSVDDLRARYFEAVGRPTGSSNASYLIWKIRQAQKGRIPIGPTRRRSSAEPGDFKVIPLRLETEVADQIDAARERLELPSRTALIRHALMLYLAKAGENDVAALLAEGE